MTLASFLKDYSEHTNQARSTAANSLFYAYVYSNDIKFNNILEENQAKRFFWLGFEIIATMQNTQKQVELYDKPGIQL